MSKKLLEKHPSHKEFIARTEIVTRYALKSMIILVAGGIILYQAIYVLTALGFNAYQEYKQEQAQQKQQDSLQQLQKDKK
jgi:hypothetical protein